MCWHQPTGKFGPVLTSTSVFMSELCICSLWSKLIFEFCGSLVSLLILNSEHLWLFLFTTLIIKQPWFYVPLVIVYLNVSYTCRQHILNSDGKMTFMNVVQCMDYQASQFTSLMYLKEQHLIFFRPSDSGISSVIATSQGWAFSVGSVITKTEENTK